MTSSCRRKSSKEQGGGKKIPFTFGKVGEEEEKEEQRREAKKTGVVEKEGQRGELSEKTWRQHGQRRERTLPPSMASPSTAGRGRCQSHFCR